MKKKDLLNSTNNINDNIPIPNTSHISSKTDSSIYKKIAKWGCLATCLCLIIISVVITILYTNNNNKSDFKIEDQVLISYTGTDKNVVIPDNVICIADYAFKKGGSAGIIETICLGEMVSEVQTYAFDGCIKLNTVTLSENNTILQKEDNAILSADRTQLIFYNGNQGTYKLPENVKKISAHAFTNTEITDLTLPEVTEIADMAFYRNQTLKSIYAPKVISIGDSAFENCRALQTISFPSVKTIGENAFVYCQALTSVELPSVLQIGAFAFRFCSNLKVLQIPNATTIGRYFIDDTSITALLIPNVTAYLDERTFDNPKPILWGYRESALEKFSNQYGFEFVDITAGVMPEGFAPIQDYVVCGSAEAPLYKSPDVSDENFIRFLQPGSTVDRIATNDSWSLLDFNGERLYIENRYLKDFSYSDPTESTKVQTYGDFQYLEYEDHIRIYHYIGSDTNIIIPTTINQKPVTELYYSFLYVDQSEKVVSLLAESVEEFVLSGSEKDHLYLYRYHNLKKLSMPALRTLPDNAFYECLVLEEVCLDRVERIGSNVFACASFTELYVPHVNRIASDAFKKTGIRTLHGIHGSYAESWAKENEYGFVDIENDYSPEYGDLSVNPADLVYYPVVQSEVDGKAYGYQGVSIAHDRKGNLYLYVDGWDTFVKTPFKQYVNYAEETVNLASQTAAVCGDYVWLIAPNQKSLHSLSIVRIDKYGNQIIGCLELNGITSIGNLTCHFSNEKDGKLMFSYYDGKLNYYLCLYQTNDGGTTWFPINPEALPHSIGNAGTAEDYRAMGFVSDQIGFVSLCYKYYEDPSSRTWLTFDGGETWIQWEVAINPLTNGYGETVEMSLDEDNLKIVVFVRGDNVASPYEMIYISNDQGNTWSKEP